MILCPPASERWSIPADSDHGVIAFERVSKERLVHVPQGGAGGRSSSGKNDPEREEGVNVVFPFASRDTL